MKTASVGDLANVSYNSLLKDVGVEYLILNVKSKKIVGRIKVLEPPKTYTLNEEYKLPTPAVKP
jgi:hypothetical protein